MKNMKIDANGTSRTVGRIIFMGWLPTLNSSFALLSIWYVNSLLNSLLWDIRFIKGQRYQLLLGISSEKRIFKFLQNLSYILLRVIEKIATMEEPNVAKIDPSAIVSCNLFLFSIHILKIINEIKKQIINDAQ